MEFSQTRFARKAINVDRCLPDVSVFFSIERNVSLGRGPNVGEIDQYSRMWSQNVMMASTAHVLCFFYVDRIKIGTGGGELVDQSL